MIYYNENGHAFRDHDGQPTGWRIVALDPRDFAYYDDDAEAMDETNWDAMVASFNSDTSLETVDGTDAFRGWFRDDVRAEADWGVLPWETMRGDDPDDDDAPDWIGRGGYREAWWSLGQLPRDVASSLVNKTVFIVREDSEAWREWENIARDLANYPLLDENAHSEREWDAWQEWWGGYGIRELIGDSADEITNALLTRGATFEGWGTVTDSDGRVYALDLGDAIDDMADSTRLELAYVTHKAMHYWNGFTGEYSEGPAREALVEYIGAVWDVLALLAAGLVETGKYAAGIVPLPFDMGGK